MTLLQLKCIVNELCRVLSDCQLNEIEVVVVVEGSSLGSTPCAQVRAVGKGIDWDRNNFMIFTSDKLSVKE